MEKLHKLEDIFRFTDGTEDNKLPTNVLDDILDATWQDLRVLAYYLGGAYEVVDLGVCQEDPRFPPADEWDRLGQEDCKRAQFIYRYCLENWQQDKRDAVRWVELLGPDGVQSLLWIVFELIPKRYPLAVSAARGRNNIPVSPEEQEAIDILGISLPGLTPAKLAEVLRLARVHLNADEEAQQSEEDEGAKWSQRDLR